MKRIAFEVPDEFAEKFNDFAKKKGKTKKAILVKLITKAIGKYRMKVIFDDGQWDVFPLPIPVDVVNKVVSKHPTQIKDIKECNSLIERVSIKMYGDWYILRENDYIGIDRSMGLVPIFKEDMRDFEQKGMLYYEA